MAKGGKVLSMLKPEGGWVIFGDDYDSIRWDEGTTPISKSEFLEGFNTVDKWLADQEKEIQNKKNLAISKLSNLGLDEDDLKALGL